VLLYGHIADVVQIQHLTMVWGQVAIGDYLIDVGEIRYMNHCIPAELGVVDHKHHSLSTLDHGANGFDYQSTGVAQAFFCDPTNPHDDNVGRDAVEHAFAYRSELNTEAGVEVAAGKCDFSLPAIPENLCYRDGVGDDLNGAIDQAARHLGYGRAAGQDNGLTVLNQVCGSLSNPHFFFLGTDGELPEVKCIFAQGGGHSSAMHAFQDAFALEFNQVAANCRSGSSKPST